MKELKEFHSESQAETLGFFEVSFRRDHPMASTRYNANLNQPNGVGLM